METFDQWLRNRNKDVEAILQTMHLMDNFFSDVSGFNDVRYRMIVNKDKDAANEYQKHLKVVENNAKLLHAKLNELPPDEVNEIINKFGRPSSNKNIRTILRAIYKGFTDLDALCKNFCKLKFHPPTPAIGPDEEE